MYVHQKLLTLAFVNIPWLLREQGKQFLLTTLLRDGTVKLLSGDFVQFKIEGAIP